MSIVKPKKYTREELDQAASLAAEHFKRARYDAEAKVARFYNEAFDKTYREMDAILDTTHGLDKLEEKAVELFGEGYLDTLRYMERPTVSADDFKRLSEAGSDAVSRLVEPANAEKAMGYLIRNMNTRLFPWREGNDEPTEADLLAAKRSVAALSADQKTKTMMRNLQSRVQEQAVKDALVADAGYTVVEAHDFDRLQDGPKAGEVFSRETSIHGVKADIVLGLFDDRIMALECKVSNTAVNSYKRLNHETVDKVVKWNGMFGELGVVGGCMLQGVFAADNLMLAQEGGVSIFWSANLKALTDFVLSTRAGGK